MNHWRNHILCTLSKLWKQSSLVVMHCEIHYREHCCQFLESFETKNANNEENAPSTLIHLLVINLETRDARFLLRVACNLGPLKKNH